ncbi:MAG TPA: STAS domain-containing protein [Anaerolineae bacterium]|nr:STAS domain-containing protein [Anaerolineae bacterium]
METEIIQLGKVVVVAVRGEVDTTTVDRLHNVFDALVTRGEQNYVIDLGGVTFMDSSGLAALASLYKRIRIGRGDVRLCCLRSEMRRIIELTRFDRVFDIFDSRAAAVASFAG